MKTAGIMNGTEVIGRYRGGSEKGSEENVLHYC